MLSDRDGRPTQDFAAVTRAVFAGSAEAVGRLTFVGFDVLHLAGEDQRARPWRERMRHSATPCPYLTGSG